MVPGAPVFIVGISHEVTYIMPGDGNYFLPLEARACWIGRPADLLNGLCFCFLHVVCFEIDPQSFRLFQKNGGLISREIHPAQVVFWCFNGFIAVDCSQGGNSYD